ncbi:MAG TPA: hypothetical protein VKY59_05105 [Spirillospora sp.]|jgi:hypothetical protein|nr:hypothetical protein [Spirillospora sp.]
MWEIFAILVLLVGIVTFSVTLALRWSVRQVSGQVERRFRHADTLINSGRIPADWLESFRAETERLSQNGAAAQELRGVAQRARETCLRNIDMLIKFFEESQFVENAETRAMLLDELRAQKQRWTQAEWDSLPG